MINVLGCQILNDSKGFHSKWRFFSSFSFFSVLFSWFLSSFFELQPSFSSSGRATFPPFLLLGGAAWSLFLLRVVLSFWVLGFFPLGSYCWVVVPWSSPSWCCCFSPFTWCLYFFLCSLFALVLRRRGRRTSFFFVSVSWCCLLLSLGWLFILLLGGVVSLPFGWCCCFFFSCLVVLRFSSSFYVELLGFFPLWWSLLFGGAAFHLLHWVVVRLFGLLLGGAAWSPLPFGGVAVYPSPTGWYCSLSLGGVAVFLLLFDGVVFLLLLLWVGLLFPPSSVGWCCLVTSLCGVVKTTPVGAVASFSCLVVLFPLPTGWCCFLSNVLTPVGCYFVPRLLLGGVFLSSFGWVFFLLFSWVVLLGLLLPWRCFPLLSRECCLVSSLFGWSLLLGGAAFHFLHWVVVLPSSVGGAAWSPLPFGGVAVFPSPFGGVSSFLAPPLLLPLFTL